MNTYPVDETPIECYCKVAGCNYHDNLERQLLEARACDSDELMVSELNGMRAQLVEAQGKLEVIERAAENYAGQAGREPLFDAGMIAAGEGILAILGESE